MSKSVANMPATSAGAASAAGSIKDHKEYYEAANVVAQGVEAPVFVPGAPALYRQITSSCEKTLLNAFLLRISAAIDLERELEFNNESSETARKNVARDSIQLSADLKESVKRKL